MKIVKSILLFFIISCGNVEGSLPKINSYKMNINIKIENENNIYKVNMNSYEIYNLVILFFDNYNNLLLEKYLDIAENSVDYISELPNKVFLIKRAWDMKNIESQELINP